MSRAVGTDLELRIGWSRPEQFVLVPSFDGRGLRIRLMRAEEDRSKVSVREVTGGTSLSEVVAGLNALGVAPNDMIDILKSINAAGALHAEFLVQ